MIDNLIRAATCRVKCGDESGTAWLVTESVLITARHCVIDAIENKEKIELLFEGDKDENKLLAQILSYNENFDVCLLSIELQIERQPLPTTKNIPLEGSQWCSFGYPESKTTIGHRISGEVSHVLDPPRSRIDIDLTIDKSNSLASYRGLSGAPVVVDGFSVGILRLKVDETLGAISIKSIENFLTNNDIKVANEEIESSPQPEVSSLADRTDFQKDFESLISKARGQYIFLEGAHGIGKTTFCNEFKPISDNLLLLGTYSLTDKGQGARAIVRAQPEIFFNWLSTAITLLLTGKPPRKKERNYANLVTESEKLLEALAKYCSAHSKQGIFFIDGINEAHVVDPGALTRLVGLLPVSLSENLTVIIASPNYHVVSSCVSQLINTQNIISLPRLSDEACTSYCSQELSNHRRNPALVTRICEKAQGHPLYLRYLIEYVNASDQESLDEFPVLSGTIEEYYESLWPRFLSDTDALNLLAIIARLRWGIRTKDIVHLLLPAEQGVFVSTINRIRHLLVESDSTEIYHLSFADFICTKTSELDHVVQERIADFCSEYVSIRYCKLNVVFHLLRSNINGRNKAIFTCQQQWVDGCVTLGVEPDILMTDIEGVLSEAIQQAEGVEVIRLLLLQQRVSFRYNTLFAQSAHLIAKAMISLKRPQEAIKYVIRFGRLIVSPEEALRIVYFLIDHEYYYDAFKILRLIHQYIHELLSSDSGIEFRDYVLLIRLNLQITICAQMADGHNRSQTILSILKHARQTLESNLSASNEDVFQTSMAQLSSTIISMNLYFHDSYITISDFKQNFPDFELNQQHLMALLYGLLEFNDLMDDLGGSSKLESFPKLFGDLEKLICKTKSLNEVYPFILDTLIYLKAPSNLVRLVSEKVSVTVPSELKILEENGVDVALADIRRGIAELRVKSFLDNDSKCPIIGSFDETSWILSLEQLLRAVAWCEGRVCSAASQQQEQAAQNALTALNSNILPVLFIDLAQRAKWENSYAIPEAVFPIIWERVTIIFRDYFQEELPRFVEMVDAKIPDQFGLYSEGLRKCLAEIVGCLVVPEMDEMVYESLFGLLRKWEEYVIQNVENRHELVPEILELIPLYCKVGAHEKAYELYLHVLNVSMGPSWYKEDQFGLMTTVLKQLPITETLKGELPMVAGYLERASGEMTFQRFIRYEKTEFLSELFRRKMYLQGCQYFQRQSCGNLSELMQDAQSGMMDRISPTIGMRFPGGALDEQHTIISAVKNLEVVDWRLAWALLEIFLCGDRRYIHDFATAFARIINHASDTGLVQEMAHKLSVLMRTDISASERTEFVDKLTSSLDLSRRKVFSEFMVHFPSNPVENESLSQVPTNSSGSEKKNENSSFDDDSMFLPGVFGRGSFMKTADEILKTAEQHLKRQNYKGAKNEAVRALKALQEGGWSIWGNLSSNASRAIDLLREGNDDANSIIRWYGTLIEGERYAPKWRLADHLITKVMSLYPADAQQSLLGHVLEHVRLMVGKAEHEVETFKFLTDNSEYDPKRVLFGFILWLVDHPHWLRRDKAACMILWLIKTNDVYFMEAARAAFSNDARVGYAGDIAAGAIDALSIDQIEDVWKRLVESGILDSVEKNCKHIGRITVLHRIAERAESAGLKDAKVVVTKIEGAFRLGKIHLATPEYNISTPSWAACIDKEFNQIGKLGLLTRELVLSLENELSAICSPLMIPDAWELEKAVANSFRDSAWNLSRWEGKVRFALGRALFSYTSQQDFRKVEAAMRVYNPNFPEQNLRSSDESRGEAIIDALEAGTDFRNVIGYSDFLYLHYCEGILEQDEKKLVKKGRFIDILAVVIENPFAIHETLQSAFAASFTSREYPNFDIRNQTGATCLRFVPDFAFLGSFTPAFPFPAFSDMVGANVDDFNQSSWRDGRSYEVGDIGRSEREGCFLSIKKSAIQLPQSKKLIWVIYLDNNLFAIVDMYNNRMR